MRAVEYESCSSLGGGELSRKALSASSVPTSSSRRCRKRAADVLDRSSAALPSSDRASLARAWTWPVTTEPSLTTSSGATSERLERSASCRDQEAVAARRRLHTTTPTTKAARASPRGRAIQPHGVTLSDDVA